MKYIKILADIWLFNCIFIIFYYLDVMAFSFVVITSLIIHYALSIFLLIKKIHNREAVKVILLFNFIITAILLLTNCK